MERKLIIAGIGGQGVIFAAKMLSQAAMLRGERVMASENHGMSQRGGSVLSYVKIGGSEAPLIRRGTADTLIALDRVEAMRNLPFVRPDGYVCVNSPNGLEPAMLPRLNELGIRVFTVNADAEAMQLGAPAVANVILLGFAAAHGALGLTVDDLNEALSTLGSAKRAEMNRIALDVGASQAASALSRGGPAVEPASGHLSGG